MFSGDGHQNEPGNGDVEEPESRPSLKEAECCYGEEAADESRPSLHILNEQTGTFNFEWASDSSEEPVGHIRQNEEGHSRRILNEQTGTFDFEWASDSSQSSSGSMSSVIDVLPVSCVHFTLCGCVP